MMTTEFIRRGRAGVFIRTALATITFRRRNRFIPTIRFPAPSAFKSHFRRGDESELFVKRPSFFGRMQDE